MTQVAEIVTFTLAAGISDAEFVALSQASEAFVRATPGFLHRQLSKGMDGRWTDYVIWQDMETAQRVAASFPSQDFAPALMAAIAPGSAEMRHEEVHWQMMAA
ncbi:hypothetical protein TRL7639_01573 [Falsiruegeria litorea R37]|uniref:Antibiotic biosynthesis monooxygenase n=1 Tax=Falsiruegeria litorea R37 TaxID=1200284 RepID=A0A1Y5SBZ4_9RHOB|nr:hypothetical protein [Falsiruegeria litorea]SLN34476.1 hypothetical protein TRL7639_01573 [Falsiruegeria litorea R37]